ncbi:MAG: hypothetical protein NTW25_00200, partial [Candidatus Kapabacteria bacterium]|nr:hypothetical protein [Candidatus Kapabacteria bacterium]
TILKNVADIERNVGELKIGMMDTPTLEIQLSAYEMPAELQYIIVNLENPTMDTDKYYTNTWILQSDRNSVRTKWYNEFAGIQRKTPGIKSIISRLNQEGIPIKSEIHIVLFNIGRAVLENVKMFDAVKKTRDTNDTTGLGLLASSGVLASYPYTLKGVANRTHVHEFVDGADTYKLFQEPVTGYLECHPFSILFYWICYLQQEISRSYLRSNEINVNYNNANGDRRFPHDNIKFRNNVGSAFLTPDQLYIIGFIQGNGENAGGHLDYSDRYKNVSLAKYQNVYDFYKDISENFASALVYYDNLTIDVETMPTGTTIITLETLPCIGNLKYNFSRIKENFNTTDDVGSDFDITSTERNIDYLHSTNETVELEQGSTLIRSAEVNIDSQFKRGDDADKFITETTSILSERKYEAKCIFDSHLHIPDVFKIDGNNITDETIYAASNFYYLDGTETYNFLLRNKVLKVHTAVDFLIDGIDTSVSYDDITAINTQTNNIVKSFIYFWLGITFSSKLNYKDKDGIVVQQAKNIRNAFWFRLQEDYGLCASLAKYLLNTFSKPNQSSIELSYDTNTKIYVNWVGDYFNISYWDIVNDYMSFISTNACLISVKQNRFTGKTDTKFLTEGT